MTTKAIDTDAINTDALQFQPGTRVRTVNSLTEIGSADLPQEVQDLITEAGMDIHQRHNSTMFQNRQPKTTGTIFGMSYNKLAWYVEHGGSLAVYLCGELEVVS